MTKIIQLRYCINNYNKNKTVVKCYTIFLITTTSGWIRLNKYNKYLINIINNSIKVQFNVLNESN